MSERPLSPGIRVFRGQTMLFTQCESCGAKLRNPTAAARHAQKRGIGHYTRARKTENEAINPGLPPENRAQNGPVPDNLACMVTCIDRGDYWASTPCLCPCHYQGLTARQMIKAKEAEDAD
jgi:hypothetical protein